jgi:hypothetical protein
MFTPTGKFVLGALGVLCVSIPGYYNTHAGATWLSSLMAGMAALGAYITGIVLPNPFSGNGVGAAPKMIAVPVLAVLALAGCSASTKADVQKSLDDLGTFARTDLQLALDLASKATDPLAPYRARCYGTLLKHVPDGSLEAAVPVVRGVASAFEVAAELDIKARAGGSIITPDVEADCGWIKGEIVKFAGRVGAKAAPVPGAAAVGDLLK